MRPDVRVQVEVKAELAVRRPPRQLIDLLDTPEDEFRAYVSRIEGNPVFLQLVESGAVQKVQTRGRVPRDKYEEYMDVELMQFLRQHRITEHAGWERDFTARDALQRIPELADRYNVPGDKLRRMVDYYQRVTSDHYGSDRYHTAPLSQDEPDYLELVPSRADVDLTDSIVLMRDFVESYGLDQAQFVADFMADSPDAAAIAERYGAPLEEIREILDALNRLHIVDSFVSGFTTEAASRATLAAPAESSEPVARILLTDNGRCVAIQFTDESVYAQRYRTNPNAVSRLAELADPDAAEDLLLELQWINQRKSLLCRLVMAACKFQYRYFLTGEIYALKPLSQAEMARELGEDEATICRLVRDKFIETPAGMMDVRYLFQRKTDAIRRIVERNAALTDNEVRRVLENDYDTKISRRTVAYHRLKFQRDEGGLGEAAD